MGRNKGLKGDGAGMDIRVFPPKARDSRFERSMGDALRQQNEELEMQEVSPSQIRCLLAILSTISKHCFRLDVCTTIAYAPNRSGALYNVILAKKCWA